MGFAAKHKVWSNNQFIGKLGPFNYLHWQVKPGKVEILSKQMHYEMKFHLDAIPGQCYYFKQQVIGRVITYPKIVLLDSIKGQNYINQLKKGSNLK